MLTHVTLILHTKVISSEFARWPVVNQRAPPRKNRTVSAHLKKKREKNQKNILKYPLENSIKRNILSKTTKFPIFVIHDEMK